MPAEGDSSAPPGELPARRLWRQIHGQKGEQSESANENANENETANVSDDDIQVYDHDHTSGDSEIESAVTDSEHNEDDEDAEYKVDAIKWAEYKDSRRARPDGFKGWHYGVMWGNYLKSFSDTEEPRDSFLDEYGETPMINEFWKGAGRHIMKYNKEPAHKWKGEIVECPPKLLRRWLRYSRHRDYDAYVRRRQRELDGLPLRRCDSDYYIRKRQLDKEEEDRRAAVLTEVRGADADTCELNGFNQPNAVAGPSGTSGRAYSPAPSYAASSCSLFSDPESESEDEVVRRKQSEKDKGNKRLRVIDSPEPDVTATKKRKLEMKSRTKPSEKLAQEETHKERRERNRVEEEAGRTQTAAEERIVYEMPTKEKSSSLANLGKNKKRNPKGSHPGNGPKHVPVRQPGTSPHDVANLLGHTAASVIARPDASVSQTTQATVAAGRGSKTVVGPRKSPPSGPQHVSPRIARTERRIKPTSPQTLISGALDASIFGAPDDSIFGEAFGSTPDAPDPRPQSSSGRGARRSKEPLFDFGDSLRSKQESPAPALEIVPTRNAPSTPMSVPAPAAASAPTTLADAVPPIPVPAPAPAPVAPSTTATASALAVTLPTRTSPPAPAPAPTEATTVVSLAMPQLAALPAPDEAKQAPKAAAPDEVLSSTPTSQIAGPGLAITEPTPVKDTQDTQEDSSDIDMDQAEEDLFGTPSPEHEPPGATAPAPALAGAISTTSAAAPTTLPPRTAPSLHATPAAPAPTAPATAARSSSSPAGVSANLPPTRVHALPPKPGPVKVTASKGLPKPKYKQPSLIKVMNSVIDTNRFKVLPHSLPDRPAVSPPTSVTPSMQTSVQAVQDRTTSQGAPMPSTGSLPPIGGSTPPTTGSRSPQDPARKENHQSSQPLPKQLPPQSLQKQQQPPMKRKTSISIPPGDGKAPVYGARSLVPGDKSPIAGTNNEGVSPNAAYGAGWSSAGGFVPHQPPPPPIVPIAVYEASRDPRKRQREPATNGQPALVQSNPQQAPQRTALSVGQQTQQGAVLASAPTMDSVALKATILNVDLELILKGGQRGSSALRGYARASNTPPRFEDVDSACLSLLLEQGAQVVEWSHVSVQDSGKQGWDMVQAALRSERMFVSREELQTNSPIASHNFVILVNRAAPQLDLGGSEHEAVAVVLSVPFTSPHTVPMLPNPVGSDFVTGATVREPEPITGRPTNLAERYGMGGKSAETLASRTCQIYPPYEYGMFHPVVEQLEKCGIKSPLSGQNPDTFLLFNTFWHQHVTSGSVSRALTRRTKFYALGPDFTLPVSQWRMQEVWKTGGLVTFSPTLILRSPTKFADIMDIIRGTPGWAAYIHPTTMVWCEQSWTKTARCPDPSKAFQMLTSALFNDNVRQFASGGDFGGLAVSYCPPPLQRRASCARWLDWLWQVYECQDYEALYRLCQKARLAQMDETGARNPPELDVLAVESEGIRDLAAMRQRPHTVPYRRYLYIGELSKREEATRAADGIVELVPAEDFVAVLSGVSGSLLCEGLADRQAV